MNAQSPTTVVVGIDGSRQAIHAAEWAIDEAVSRDITLRLVHATQPDKEPAAIEYAEAALRAASAAVEATGKPVMVATAIVHGSPDAVLIAESSGAEMLCVGSVGIGSVARILLGSTAATLATEGYCPVAIIRSRRHAAPSDSGWIAVVVDDDPDNDAVVAQAMREAKLRKASLLAIGVWRSDLGEIPYDQLDRRLGKWVNQYPDVHVQPVAARSGPAEFLRNTDEAIQLTVVGTRDANHIAALVGPPGHPIFAHAECSVLIVRD